MQSAMPDAPPPYNEVMREEPTKNPGATVTVESVSTVPIYNAGTPGVEYMPPSAHHPPGYYPSPSAPSYGTINTHHTTVLTPPIVLIGGCPSCRIGVLEDNYPCCGWCLAVVFFPIGILFCLAMKNKRCTTCGAEF